MSEASVRVLHVLENVERGGTETLALDVLRYAAQTGLSFSGCAFRGGGMEEQFRASGSPFTIAKRRLPVDFPLVWKLRRIIRNERIAIVHCHQPVDGLHGYLAARGTSTRILLTFHGDPSDQTWKDVAVARFLIPRVRCNVAVSEASRLEISRSLGMEGRGRWAVVHNGIDTKRLEADGGDVRKELRLAPDALLLGMVGNFQPWKDHLTLVRAFADVARSRHDAHLLLIGGRSGRDPALLDTCTAVACELGLEDRVHFLGVRSDAVTITRQLDYFVFATRGDTYALALVEALMLGIPCIVARTPAMVEISGGDDHVTYFTPASAPSMSEQIRRAMSDRESVTTKAQRAKDWSRQHHTIEAHVANLLRLYEEMLSNPGHRPHEHLGGK